MKKTDPLNAAAELPEQPAKAQPKRPVNHSGFYCYIGPNLAGLIQHGTIFRGSWDDALKAASAAIEKYPLAKNMIVSGDDLPAERLKIKKPGNALYENYRKLAGKQEV